MTSSKSKPDEPPRKYIRRQKCNKREKQRNLDLNKGYEEIVRRVPFVPNGIQNLPKIKILKLATAFIEHLDKILNGDLFNDGYNPPRPYTMGDFEYTVMDIIQKRNNYTSRIHEAGPEGRPKRTSRNGESLSDNEMEGECSSGEEVSPQSIERKSPQSFDSRSPEIPYFSYDYNTFLQYPVTAQYSLHQCFSPENLPPLTTINLNSHCSPF